jgi:hypothetical protein
VAQVLEKAKEEQHAILHTLEIFEGEFEAVCRTVFRVKVIVSKVACEESREKQGEGSTNSVGMCANPLRWILILNNQSKPKMRMPTSNWCWRWQQRNLYLQAQDNRFYNVCLFYI